MQVKKPVVLYVHGGGWRIGDKANNLENKTRLFQSLDYIFISINYRLSPFLGDLSAPDRVKFTDHNIDVADAIRWAVDNIAGYGGDGGKIVLLGHSAGAHLVSLTGTNTSFLDQAGVLFSSIKGVASIDTEGYDVRQQVNEGIQLYVTAFGTDEQENIAASPIFTVMPRADNPKFFIAKRGTTARMAIAHAFIQELNDNGVTTFQVNGSGYDHEGINRAIGAEGETVITPSLVEFLEVCFE